MRRERKSSFGGRTAATTTSTSVQGTGGFDPQRRTELLAEARRKRVAWVEEARGVDEGVHGARRRREDEAAENGRKAESELERLFPSAVKFHDFLSGVAGDTEESPAGDLSAILQPFMVQDVDIGDDRPIPSHKEGADAYDVFLDKLKHPRAADVVKSLQQFVAAFKARAGGAGASPLPSPGPRGAPGSSSMYTRLPVAGASNSSGRVWGAELLSGGGVNSRKDGHVGGGSQAGGGGGGGVTAATMSGMMRAFLGRVEAQMRENILWRRETQAQWEETRESLERVVMHKVFDRAYALASDQKRDDAISNRLRSLSFLTEEHLGVPPLVDTEGAAATWSDAENELLKMAVMRCPGDMLRCIMRCTRIVAGLITGSEEGGVLPGADEFLPALILLVKRANPPNIHSNLEFVQSFRDSSKLLSEAGYVLTQLVSAVCFLEEVDASVLSIAHGDFERGLKGFQENARVGLHAHQQEVKKEEAHERYLHSSSQRQGDNANAGSSAVAVTASAAAADGTTSAGGSGDAANRVSGPVPLPEPSKPREIAPAEVRAKRLAGSQLSLDSTGSNGHPRRQTSSAPSTASPVQPSPGIPSSHPRSRRGQHHMQLHHVAGNGGREKGTGLAGRLRFVGCTAAELRMSEVPALLAEHQQLARLCEELLEERGERELHRRHL